MIMSDPIPQFPLATYKLQFRPVDTTKCIHVESFASMEYSLQLDYAKLYHVPHAETLGREVLIDIFCTGNKWIIALKHPEHTWRPSRSGGITITRNHKAAAAARLQEEERAVEEQLTEDQPIAERFPSPEDEYEGPTPPPEIPPPTWEPPVPVRLELTYPPKPRDLGVNEHGERITEPVPEDFLGAMMQESHLSFESAKNKVREAIDDSNAALADVLKFQAKLKAQRRQCRDLMDAVYSIVGPEVARKIEEAVKVATRDGVVEQWEDPDVFRQEDKEDDPLEEENHLPENKSQPAPLPQPQQIPATQPAATQTRQRGFLVPELPSRIRNAIGNNNGAEGSSLPNQTSHSHSHSNGSSTSSKDGAVGVQTTPSQPIPPQQIPATQPAATQTRPRVFLVPELPSHIRNAIDNNNNTNGGVGSSLPKQASHSRSHSSGSSASSKRCREDDDDAVEVQATKRLTPSESFKEVLSRLGSLPKKARRGESPFNNTTTEGGNASDSSSSFSGVNGVPWNKYEADDATDEVDGTYTPSDDSESDDLSSSSSSGTDSDDWDENMEFYDRIPLSPSGLSDSGSDSEAPFGSQGASRPALRHPIGPRPPAPPPRQHEQRAKKLKRNDNCLQVNPETGRLEVIHASDDPERGRRFREIPVQVMSIENVLDDITTCDHNKFDFDEEAWKSFEVPEETK